MHDFRAGCKCLTIMPLAPRWACLASYYVQWEDPRLSELDGTDDSCICETNNLLPRTGYASTTVYSKRIMSSVYSPLMYASVDADAVIMHTTHTSCLPLL